MECINRTARPRIKALDFYFNAIVSYPTLILHLLQLKSKGTNKYNSKGMSFWNQPFWGSFFKELLEEEGKI